MESSLIPVLIFHNDILLVYWTSISYTGSAQHSSFVLSLSAYNKKMRDDQKNFLIIIILIIILSCVTLNSDQTYGLLYKTQPGVDNTPSNRRQTFPEISGPVTGRGVRVYYVYASKQRFEHACERGSSNASVELPYLGRFQSGPTVTPEGK